MLLTSKMLRHLCTPLFESWTTRHSHHQQTATSTPPLKRLHMVNHHLRRTTSEPSLWTSAFISSRCHKSKTILTRSSTPILQNLTTTRNRTKQITISKSHPKLFNYSLPTTTTFRLHSQHMMPLRSPASKPSPQPPFLHLEDDVCRSSS